MNELTKMILELRKMNINLIIISDHLSKLRNEMTNYTDLIRNDLEHIAKLTS